MSQLHRVRPRLFWASATTAALLVLASALPAGAVQSGPNDRPSPESAFDTDRATFDEPAVHVYVVDGRAWLERDGETRPLDENELVVEGDRISTEQGRVELLFRDGSALALDENTAIELLGPAFVRLLQGHLGLTVDRRVAPDTYRVDAADGTIWMRSAGEYRIRTSAFDDEAAALVVIRGLAEVQTSRQRSLVRAGYEATYAPPAGAVRIDAVPVTRWAAFDRWIDAQERERVSLSTSSYLPNELRSYSRVLDSHGSWQYDTRDGYVWYPNVTTDWYPYSTGRWATVGSYGWTWVGVGRWAWPTHHYGRWGHSGARWYWIPGRQWAPAWVTWATSPSYVAWCPIGFTPSIGLSVSFGTTWRGWSAVPARVFAGGRVVAHRDRLPLSRIPDRLVVSRPPTRPLSSPRTNARSLEPGRPGPGEVNTARPRPGVLANTRGPLDRDARPGVDRGAPEQVDRTPPPAISRGAAGGVISRQPTRQTAPRPPTTEPRAGRTSRPEMRSPRIADDTRPSPPPADAPAPPTRSRRAPESAPPPASTDPGPAARARRAGGVERPAPVERSAPQAGAPARSPGASRPPSVERPAPSAPTGPPSSGRAVPRAEPRGGGERRSR